MSHFPKVERLVDLGDGTYRWEMEKIGVGKYYLQTVYACRYTNDREAGRVEWKPVPGVCNGIIEGAWQIQSKGDSTHIDFRTSGELSLPLPSLARLLVSPVVVREFEGLVARYIENLKEALS